MHSNAARQDKPCRFTSVEQKLSGIRKWYDKALKDTTIANPFRNERLLELMNTLEKQKGRAVANKPKK